VRSELLCPAYLRHAAARGTRRGGRDGRRIRRPSPRTRRSDAGGSRTRPAASRRRRSGATRIPPAAIGAAASSPGASGARPLSGRPSATRHHRDRLPTRRLVSHIYSCVARRTSLPSPGHDSRSRACTHSSPHRLGTRSSRRKPSFSITRRDAAFVSIAIETTRAKPSSPNDQAIEAAPASVAMPRPHHAGSSAQPISGSCGQAEWYCGPVRPISSPLAAHSTPSSPKPRSCQWLSQRSNAASLSARVWTPLRYRVNAGSAFQRAIVSRSSACSRRSRSRSVSIRGSPPTTSRPAPARSRACGSRRASPRSARHSSSRRARCRGARRAIASGFPA